MNRIFQTPKEEPAKLHAPDAAARLAAAEAALIELDAELGPLSLAVSEGEAGAEKKLLALETRIGVAKNLRFKADRAHRHAILLDHQELAAGAAKMRAEQLAVFERAGAERVAAMTEVLELIAKASVAFGRYAAATGEMVTAVPSGTHLPVMGFGDGTAGNFLGNCEFLIGREAFRIAALAGTARLPFAKVPPLSQGDNHLTMQPAIEVLQQAQEVVLRDVKVQIGRLNIEAMTAAGMAPPPSPPPLTERRAEVRADPPKPPLPIAEKPVVAAPIDAFAYELKDSEAVAGIGKDDCATACGPAGCIITGAICAHPYKGGVQHADKKPHVLARYAEACKALDVKNVHEMVAQ